MTKGVANPNRHTVALTKKEEQAIELAVQGYNDKEISRVLQKSTRAVSVLIWRTMNRLGALNRAQMGAIYERMKK